jgi:hypothetical protein
MIAYSRAAAKIIGHPVDKSPTPQTLTRFAAVSPLGGIPSPSLNADSNKDQHEHEIP